MSLQALVWAFSLELRPATTKFVLVALADFASDENLCFPAVSTLVTKTSLDRKTVLCALERLETAGLIQDTGKRCGSTKQVKIYRLDPNSPKNGIVSESKSPVFPTKESRFSVKESQKRDTEPLTNRTDGTGTTAKAVDVRKEKEKQAEEIYEQYPRKVARGHGIKAIMRAMTKVSFEELMAKTRAFSAAWSNRPKDDLQYCPHPATWYNGERYHDDPSQWQRTAMRQEQLGPLHVQIDAIEKAIAKHPCNRDSTLYDESKITPALRDGFKGLKDKRDQLRRQHTEAIMGQP